MSDFENWEKPWVRDIRGLNRSRPTGDDRGVETKPAKETSSKKRIKKPQLRVENSQSTGTRMIPPPPVENSIRTEPPVRWLGDHARASVSGYDYQYDHIIGETIPGNQEAAIALMTALQLNPDHFFPFHVIPFRTIEFVKGKPSISIMLNGVYLLTNKDPHWTVPPGNYPVEVIEATKTSFTFGTMEGHFDSPGSTIRFEIWTDKSGLIHLVQTGHAISNEPNAQLLFAPAAAKIAWEEQAENLRRYYFSTIR
jgi:hypothetical protein